jgi:hypothetical protein
MVITRAIKKHGNDNFEKHIYYLPIELLDYFEIEMIKRLNTIVPNGYNCDSGGNKNKIVSLETRDKIRNSRLGKSLSESAKAKHKTKWQDPKYRKHMSDIHKGKAPGNKGIYIYPTDLICEYCKQPFKRDLRAGGKKKRRFCSMKCWGKHNSGENNSSKKPEIRKKQSKNRIGIKLAEETKRKISEFQKGKIRVQRITVFCLACGKGIIKRPSNPKKVCNSKCNGIYRSKKIISIETRKKLSESIKNLGLKERRVEKCLRLSQKRLSEDQIIPGAHSSRAWTSSI